MRQLRRKNKPEPVKPAFNAGLTLFVANDSVVGNWLRLLVAEKEVERARLVVIEPGEFDEDLLLLNPSCSLPTLADRQGIITIPWVIAEYLDERYPHPPLMPSGSAERAYARELLSHMLQDVFPAMEHWLDGGGKVPVAVTQALNNAFVNTGSVDVKSARYTMIDCAWSVILNMLQSRGVETWPDGVREYAEALWRRAGYRRAFNRSFQ